MARLAALLAAAALAMSTAACASPSPASTTPASDATGDATATAGTVGAVAVFTPSDGITLSQNTPLNKWAALAKDIQQAFQDRAGDGSDAADRTVPAVQVTASSDLASQSQAVQDYVVDRAGRGDGSSTTLVVAPVTDLDQVTRQYGDYVRQDLDFGVDDGTGDAASSDASATAAPTADADEASSPSASASGSASASASQDATRLEAGRRLVSALRLARESGMHVVLVSSRIKGFTPTLFVQFGTAELIGRLQAQQLVGKLELDRTSPDNPKSIEVLIPFSPTRKDGTAADPTFAADAFRGIWEVLGPYFADGRATSPSHTLAQSTTADDWRKVAYDPSKTDATKNELTGRLGMANRSTHRRIDGVLAMNDAVAAQVVSTLTSLGYAGSAADINPEITISGIVGSFAGKVDVQRGKVPAPRKAPTPTPGASDDPQGIRLPFTSGPSSADDDPSWPIITGYGAYVNTIPQIVNGKQWMTALGDRKGTADDLAEAVLAMNAGGDVSAVDGVTRMQYGDDTVPAIVRDQLAVSASNLKGTLIDTGYVSPADAGL